VIRQVHLRPIVKADVEFSIPFAHAHPSYQKQTRPAKIMLPCWRPEAIAWKPSVTCRPQEEGRKPMRLLGIFQIVQKYSHSATLSRGPSTSPTMKPRRSHSWWPEAVILSQTSWKASCSIIELDTDG